MDQIYTRNGYFRTLFGYVKRSRNQQDFIANVIIDHVVRTVTTGRNGSPVRTFVGAAPRPRHVSMSQAACRLPPRFTALIRAARLTMSRSSSSIERRRFYRINFSIDSHKPTCLPFGANERTTGNIMPRLANSACTTVESGS